MFFSVGAWLPTTTCASSLRILSFQTHTSSTLGPKRSEPATGGWASLLIIDPLQTIEKYNNLKIASFTRDPTFVCFFFWNSDRNHDHYDQWSNTHDSNHCFTITYPHTIIMNQTQKCHHTHPVSFMGWTGNRKKTSSPSLFLQSLSISDPYCSVLIDNSQ